MDTDRDENEGRTFKLQLMVSPAELNAIDDWRFEQRMATRAAAIRELIRLGMASSTGEDTRDAEGT